MPENLPTPKKSLKQLEKEKNVNNKIICKQVIKLIERMEMAKMKQDKMHLINKIFNNETIRTVWDAEEENTISVLLIQLVLLQKVVMDVNIGIN